MTKGLWEQSSTNIWNKSNKQDSGLRKFIWWVNKPLQGSASDGRVHHIAATNCWDSDESGLHPMRREKVKVLCICWYYDQKTVAYVGGWGEGEPQAKLGQYLTLESLFFSFFKLNTDTKAVSPKTACIHSFQLGRNAMPPLSISFK